MIHEHSNLQNIWRIAINFEDKEVKIILNN
jgi:hypothetical protein